MPEQIHYRKRTIQKESQFWYSLAMGFPIPGVMVAFKTWTDIYSHWGLTSSPVVTFWTDRSSFSTMRRIDLMTSSYSRRLREIRALFWHSNAPSRNPESWEKSTQFAMTRWLVGIRLNKNIDYDLHAYRSKSSRLSNLHVSTPSAEGVLQINCQPLVWEIK